MQKDYSENEINRNMVISPKNINKRYLVLLILFLIQHEEFSVKTYCVSKLHYNLTHLIFFSI